MTGDPERDRLEDMAARIRNAGGPSAAETPEAAEERARTARASRPAIDFVAAVVACVGLGWFVDYKFDTAPWCAVGGIFVGFAIGMLNMWRAMSKQIDAERKGN